jgi:hypothetical protein
MIGLFLAVTGLEMQVCVRGASYIGTFCHHKSVTRAQVYADLIHRR